MGRRKKVKPRDRAKILYVYDDGESTITEIMDRTGYTRDMIAQVLPVDEIEREEQKALKEILAKYGY